jgi:hypothetical protein
MNVFFFEFFMFFSRALINSMNLYHLCPETSVYRQPAFFRTTLLIIRFAEVDFLSRFSSFALLVSAVLRSFWINEQWNSYISYVCMLCLGLVYDDIRPLCCIGLSQNKAMKFDCSSSGGGGGIKLMAESGEVQACPQLWTWCGLILGC